MSAESEVRRRIQERGEFGKITFAEFMEIALYWPNGGHYTSREPVGAHGDYYTSPVVHPSFGALLAVQLFQMWLEMGRPAPFTVLELGAGNGLLCQDICSYAVGLPNGFDEALRYVCLDRRAAFSVVSRTLGTSRVVADRLPFEGLTGCVLSNEYLDAFPVHQVVMTDDGLKEVHVGLSGGELVELHDEPSCPGLAERLDDLGIALAPGQTAEINLALEPRFVEISEALTRGFVLTIDYGRTAQDLYDPETRLRGTLVTYHQHIQTDAPLTLIGRQDITAQVDFTTAASVGKKAGLETLGLVTQRDFLSNLGLNRLEENLAGQNLTPLQIQANRAGIKELVRPGGLGEFKVLVQGKNIGNSTFWGLDRPEEASALIDSLQVPLLTEHHLSIPAARNRGGETEFGAFWPA